MKSTLVMIAILAMSLGLEAQTLNDGIKMYKYEKYQSAEKILSGLAAGNAQANYYLGLCQLGQDKVSDAKASFAKFPEDVANMSGMARVAFTENNATQGMQILQTIISKAKKKEWEPFKYAADAITYTDGGNTQQAIDWYKTAIQKNDNAELHIALGDAYQKMPGGGGEAMNNYDHVVEKEPGNSLAHSRRGALWYAARTYKEALDSYNKSKDADPSNPLPYRDLGRAYARTGKYEEALKNNNQYYELSDKSCDDKIERASIQYQAKRFQDAIQLCQEIIAACPNVKAGVYGVCAYSQYETKDYPNALNNVRIFFSRINPKKLTPLDYQNYGWIMLQSNMSDSATYYFNKSLEADTVGDKSGVLRQLAETFKTQKEYTRSAEWYARLVTQYPNTQAADYAWRTIMYYYAKDYTTGKTTAEQWFAKYPDPPSGLYWQGRNAAAEDNEAKTGAAIPFYTQWLEKVGPNYDKKTDLQKAYQYLLLYYYNTNDKEKMKQYKDLIKAIDPNDDLVKQLDELDKKAAAPKPAPAKKPATPGKK